MALTHGRAQVQLVEIGARRDGTIVGLRADLLADMGAYPIGAFLPDTTQEMLSGVYAIPRIASRGRSVVTNATPVGPYRGAGRPEATALIERAVDLVASELGLDAVDVRRRNLIPSDAFPYRTASGTVYDVGDYERALDAALAAAGYERLRVEQGARRERGDPLAIGIGVATYVEITSFSSKDGELDTSTTTCAPSRAADTPSPVRVFTPVFGATATASWPCSDSFATTLEPISPVPPTTMIFAMFLPFVRRGPPLGASLGVTEWWADL